MSTDLRDLYQEIILEHSRKPKNAGVLEDPTAEAQGKTRSAETALPFM